MTFPTPTSHSKARDMASAARTRCAARWRRSCPSWDSCSGSSRPTSSSRCRSRTSRQLLTRLRAMAVADLTRNAVDVLPKGELERKLKLGRPLRVKLGIDATSPDIHLGFAYVLDRLAEFQRAGHIVVLIVGDYTARIGDPSGRSDERPVLPDEVIDANAEEFAQQAFRVLDRERTEIRFNGEWLGALSYADVVRLARTITVARILERDDFSKRFGAHEPISVSELLYPLMQAYDSVAIEADIEIGGTDQLYNLLTGRDVMEHYGHDAPEDVPEAALPDGDPVHLPALLVEHLGVPSTSEARRLIVQGGVRIDGEPAADLDIPRKRLEGALVQAGKRRFMRFRAA